MSGPIRVAHILPWSAVGGTEVATLRIAQLVGNEGFEHLAYVIPGESPCRSLFADAGIETRAFTDVQPSWRHPLPWWRSSRALARDLRARGVTLMHCADVLAAHYVAWAGRLAGLPVLCHVRNRFESITRRDRSFLLPVGRYAFVSQDTWKRFGLHVPARRGRVIYDGIDVPPPLEAAGVAVRREFGIPAEAILIGMVGRIAPQKDHATLIRAAARVRGAGRVVRYLLVGDDAGAREWREQAAALRTQIAQSGLDEEFIFTGHRADVRRLMAALDVFVLATHQEGLPLVILEAMALARPVLATNVDGVPEIVRDGVTGFLHGHGDDALLAAQLSRLVADPDLGARLGIAGRELVRSSFSTERFARAMRELYGEVAGRDSSS